MSTGHYDAVIVGGGVAGGVVARILSEAGKRVLILEAGTAAAMDPANYRSYLERYYTLGGLRGMPNSPYPYNADAPSPGSVEETIGTESSYYMQAGPLNFMSDYLRSAGGTTLHWQGTSLRMVPNDFRMLAVYGHGRDWPIGYDDLEPDYRRAELEIGVSADVEDQRIFGVWFPEGYVYPMHRMPPSCIDQFFDAALKGAKVKLHGGNYPLRVISIPQGRNSTPNPAYDGGRGYQPASAIGDRDSGQRCQGNSSCLPICPVQAKYSALKTLNAVVRNKRVELRSQCVASKLVIDAASGRITGVEYKRYKDRKSTAHVDEVAHGTIVVLAANAIENATLLLASGAANKSDQVGRNLMDHPYLYAWGTAPRAVYPFRGPDTTSAVDSLRDGKFREQHASFRGSLSNWGWSGEPGLTIGSLLTTKTFGKAFRNQLRDQMTREVKLGIMCEQLPSATNRVTIDSQYRDPLGNFRPVLNYNYDDYSLDGAVAAIDKVWGTITSRAGIVDHTSYPAGAPGYQHVTFKGRPLNIMGSGHIAGTHRMGSSKRDSVVDRNLRSWDHQNLYLVGAGSMVTIGTANPTLTAVALTVRAANAMLKGLS